MQFALLHFAVDIISAIEFDKTGDHLATGDRGGRVVLFERTDITDLGCQRELEKVDYSISRHPEFRYKTEFQSHEPEFDYLKSLEIEEKINKIRWCQTSNNALFLLSTNDKTIKFWKVQEKKVKKISEMNVDPSKNTGNIGVACTSSSTSLKMHHENGACAEKFCSCLYNDISIPRGGVPSLHLPVSYPLLFMLTLRNPIPESLCGTCKSKALVGMVVVGVVWVVLATGGVVWVVLATGGAVGGMIVTTVTNGSVGVIAASWTVGMTGAVVTIGVVAVERIRRSVGVSLPPSIATGKIDWRKRVASHEASLVPRCRRIYAHAHDYHINSISNNSDGETFISADDLRVNLWNLEVSNQSFNIVDVKPANMEDLTEVITSAEFHPTHCNMLAYSSSKGSIRLIDLRQSALCDTHSKLFEDNETPGSRSFFTEIIASISDIKFGRDGRHILSRDYMTLKLWDINMDSGPVATFQVHEYLRPKLCDLYENDSIFDKFECCISGDGSRIASGSYSNLFRVFGTAVGSAESTTLEASKNPMRKQVQTPVRSSRSLSSLTRAVRRGADSPGVDSNGNSYDFTTKLLHLAWHPSENSIACAAANSLYMYYA
ncbi:hypothetical protein GIB67_040963 [Kingdonia uniflora]|uniref:Serine/threonine-protein phosphatase 2A 55 kDa regulatory subunit B n=1 Tax=Kingdonia uniflora TaxID=39325 RepID=A0A7J7NBT7_9MAGN|nr:hypothetical protein GIB67_040963 [Kingdonia uniflora]